MKTLSVAPINPAVESHVKQMLRSGSKLENVISSMRSGGLNKIESIKLLRTHAGMSLAESKDAVHLSATWSDSLESDNALHETASRAAEQALHAD